MRGLFWRSIARRRPSRLGKHRLFTCTSRRADMSGPEQWLEQLQLDGRPQDQFQDALPESVPVDFFRTVIASELARALPPDVDRQAVFAALDTTNKRENGDLVVAMPRLKLGGNPADRASEWASKFGSSCGIVERVIAEKAFLRFYLDWTKITPLIVKKILQEDSRYGTNMSGHGKRVLIEFSSPNIAKPFHAGHLRSTIIGAFLSNIHKACGWEVIRMNYLGDWGKQFGLLAVGYQQEPDERRLKENPIHYLFDVYVKINRQLEEHPELNEQAREFFRTLEDGDQNSLAIWQRFRDLSITKYKETYSRLNIEYDVYSGESQVSQSVLEQVSRNLSVKGISEEDDGAVLVDFFKHCAKSLGKALVRKKDGTSLYLTRDIGAAIERYETYKFDKMIYVVSSQQDLHLAQLFKILELMGYDWAAKCAHVNYGLVLGMSTRKGVVKFLDDILDEVQEKMHDVMRKNEEKYIHVENPNQTADLIGISALLIQDMSAKRINNYKLDVERMYSFEGDTGPYLQYSHSRLMSIFRKADIPMSEVLDADLSLLTEPITSQLGRMLSSYPDVVRTVMKTQEPAAIVTYLFKLTHIVNSMYDQLYVANQAEEVKKSRLALYVAARIVLGNGMRLLGLTPVER